MSVETVHLLKGRIKSNWHLFLLFVPLLVFVLTLAFLISTPVRKQFSSKINNSDILGVQSWMKK